MYTKIMTRTRLEHVYKSIDESFGCNSFGRASSPLSHINHTRVQTQAKANAPVLLGSDELRFLTSLLRASGTYPFRPQPTSWNTRVDRGKKRSDG